MTRKKDIAIVQARYDSSRLPGKLLLPLAGRSVLWHLWQRLARVPELDEVVFATTSQDSDRIIVDEVSKWGGTVFTYDGQVDDLLGRYLACGAAFDADIIAMVDGDCPLVHPQTISNLVNALRAHPQHDYAELDNASIEGGVAVLRLDAYRKIAQFLEERVPRQKHAAYREHATLCIMDNPDWFSIVAVACFEELKGVKHRLWLDTPSDYQFLQSVYEKKYPSDGGIVSLPEVVELLKTEPDLRQINAHVGQKQGAHSSDTAPIYIEGSGDMADNLMRILPEEFGLSTTRQGADGACATIRIESSETDFSLSKEEGKALITLGADHPRSLTDIVMLVSQALGESKLESGYFDSEGRGNDMIEVRCPLCASETVTPLWKAPTESVNAICDRCGHVYLHRRPSEYRLEENYRLYAQSYPVEYRLRDDTPFGEMAKSRANRIARLMNIRDDSVSVLELGAGDGHFLSELPASWFRVAVEPSRDQAGFLRKYRDFDEVWGCGYSSFQVIPPSWPKRGFDVVASFHVLEHVADPSAFLGFVRACLADEGFAVIAVPNLENLGRDLIEFYYLANGFHLHTFHPDSLQWLAGKCRFSVDQPDDELQTDASRSNAVLQAGYPSSLLMVLRKTGTQSPKPLGAASALTMKLAKRYHNALATNLAALNHKFELWAHAGKRVMVFGAGVHTDALFLAVPGAARCVIGVVDDDASKHGTVVAEFAVTGRNNISASEPDVILVSSLSAENRILESLREPLSDSVELVGIYRDIFGSEQS